VVNQSDPRSIRTVARLRRAAEALGATKPLHAISVTELCHAAGVHRTTFYAHYNSVTEVVADALGDRFAHIVDSREPSDGDSAESITQQAIAELHRMLTWVREHDADLRVLQAAPVVGHGAISQRLREWVRAVHDDLAAAGAPLPPQRDLLDLVVTAALSAGIVEWAGREAEDVEEFLDGVLAGLPSWWQQKRP